MSLNADIQALLANVRGQLPPAMFDRVLAVFSRLQDAHVGANAPKPGQPAPDAPLLTITGAATSIKAELAHGPTVLIFYRGRWCPFCDLTLRAFNAEVAAFSAAGVRLVAISPQTVEETQATSSERGLAFDVFCDPHNVAAQAFGLAWALTADERDLYATFNSHLDRANGDDRWELPAPAAFVIDHGGVVRWSWVNADWTKRPEPADVLAAVKAAARN